MSERIDPTLTPIKDKHERASAEFWEDRVKRLGNHKSPFLDMPQEEIDAFTARHRQWIEPWTAGKRVLEIGCGYGRSMYMFRNAETYVGIDCVESLIEEAKEKFKEVFGGRVDHNKRARKEDRYDDQLPWPGYVFKRDLREDGFGGLPMYINDWSPLGFHPKFDICVAVAVISSVEPYFHDLRRRIFESLEPGGVILWLEEDYTRIDYK